MKPRASFMVLALLFSGSAMANSTFTINQPETAVPVTQNTPTISVGQSAPDASLDFLNSKSLKMDEYSEITRKSLATKLMTLYNFKSQREETFQYQQVDTDLEYARSFLPPSESVYDIFDYFVENEVSPGLALLLTYKKLEETLKDINQ
ncbi:hypothetical protein LMH73_027345 [Vibrio splendidus]|nr:hypothetical protein [Vibrio splendidus]MCC4880393.1 hypothetical protein [Vibrio splendidus]